MSWNYRVVKSKDGYYGLREVYYKNPHTPQEAINGYTARDIAPGGETLEELRRNFESMKGAFEKPILAEQADESLTEED